MSERICGIDMDAVYLRGRDLFRVATIADRPTMTLVNVETGERVGGVIGAPIFDGFVELVPKQATDRGVREESALVTNLEHRGCVEIRWTPEGDPDDVVAPWGAGSLGRSPIAIHVERMSDGTIWMAIYNSHDPKDDSRVVMWFHARKKEVLEWTVSEDGA